MSEVKKFPEGMEPLGDSVFAFKCHPGVSCFTVCCQRVDLQLYPYDVLRLKNALGIDSEEFMRSYTRLVSADNPFFPTVMLALTAEGRGACPFLAESGCTIYEHRPSDCRSYPLERAVDRRPGARGPRDHYFLVHHDYCKGHAESETVTARQYVRSQQLEPYNTFNEMWAEMDTIFRTNPWQGEGVGGPRQQLAFMVCYNIDGFRRLAAERNLLEQFRLPKDRKRAIGQRDEELLKFGFDWLKLLFTGKSSLVKR